jgi:hypothetical protein
MALDWQRTMDITAAVKGTDASKQARDLKKFWKTQPCRFYPKCMKGEACPFAHAQGELHARPDLTKTTICRAWQRAECPLSSSQCKFAHGPRDLRANASPASAPPLPNKKALETLRRRTRDSRSKTSGAHGGVNGDVASEQAPSDTSGGHSRLSSFSKSSSEGWDDTESVTAGRRMSDFGSFTPGGRDRRVPTQYSNHNKGSQLDSLMKWGDMAFGNALEDHSRAMEPTKTVQIPVLIDVHTGQIVCALACIMQGAPQAVSPPQSPAAIEEAALRAAMPAYYED